MTKRKTSMDVAVYVINALIDAGSDHDGDLVRELSRKAGYLWECREIDNCDNEECLCDNWADQKVCGSCGKPRR